MEPLSNPGTQSPLQNPENRTAQRGFMEKFENVVLKLSQTPPIAPLTPPARTLLQEHMDRFASHYKTPDHPPYSAMIEKAIQDLNERQGSSEDSISHFLQKEYNCLPWAHPAMLKRHLGNLCVSGDIVVTHNKRYKLPKESPVPNSPKTEVKRTCWKWDWEKDKRRRLKEEKATVKNHQEQDFKKSDSPDLSLTSSERVSRRSLRLSLAKPELTEVMDCVVLPTQHCCKDCPNINPVEESSVDQVKPGGCMEKSMGESVMMMSSDDQLGGQEPGQTPKRARGRPRKVKA